jgi:hypothetical protein
LHALRRRLAGGTDEKSRPDQAVRGTGPRHQNQSGTLFVQQGRGQESAHIANRAAEKQGALQITAGERISPVKFKSTHFK